MLSTPRAPWQRAYVERLIGSIRRECLDHVIVINERSLERTLKSFSSYYHCWRTHLSLGIDAQKADRYRLPTKVRSSKFRKSVVCIITTNAELPDLHHKLSRGHLTAAATCRWLRSSCTGSSISLRGESVVTPALIPLFVAQKFYDFLNQKTVGYPDLL